MTLKQLFFSAAALLLSATFSANAKITLPEQLGDYCVLQQQTAANLWGRAAANSKVSVKVSWSKAKYSVTADSEGRWLLTVNTPAASYDPQTITISDKDGSVTLHDVLIGEVWLAGGQSNMEMPLNGFNGCPVEGSAETILRAGEWKGKVREVKIPKTGNPEPQEFVQGKWVETNPVTAKDFSAVAWHFAVALNSALDVPIGIVACNWGGSAVESWLPEDLVHSYPANTVPGGSCEPVMNPGGWYECTSPYVMYNAMICPVSHYTIKGFIWYQGETNAGLPQYYPERLATMVQIWRDLWGDQNLPFYEVELAPWRYGGDGTSGARIREAQHKAVEIIPHSGIVCTNDLAYPYEKDQIHPCQKKQVGERLALLALNRNYDMAALACEGPVYKDIEISGNTVTVNFKNTGWDGLSPWHDIVGFELAGEDRVFYPAKAERKDVSVVVTCDQVPNPVAVRYCFRDFQIGNLTGSMNLPAVPFRSDNW
jgi:sialate O-acetylesterase